MALIMSAEITQALSITLVRSKSKYTRIGQRVTAAQIATMNVGGIYDELNKK